MKSAAFESKIITLSELQPLARKLRSQGLTIVSNNGSYDIMHLGHVQGLFNAAEQADVLIVGLNSDESIKAYKSKNRPINDQYMRLRMMAAIACVDYVFLFDETTPLSWLAKLQPEVHSNGAEYGKACIEREVVESYGGRIYLLPMVKGYKTSMIIDKIKQGDN